VRVTKPDKRRDGRLASRPVGQLYEIGGHHDASRISEFERAAKLGPALKCLGGLRTRQTRATESDVSERAARGSDKALQGHVARQWLDGNRETLTSRQRLDLPYRYAVMGNREHQPFLTAKSMAA
jgi:hypothetical protein